MSRQRQHAARLHKESPPGALLQHKLQPAAAGCLAPPISALYPLTCERCMRRSPKTK